MTGRKTVTTVLRFGKTPHCRTRAGNRNSCFGGTYFKYPRVGSNH
jgi:hypothetical protein